MEGHEIAKRYTKYKTNLETRSNHFSRSEREKRLEKPCKLNQPILYWK